MPPGLKSLELHGYKTFANRTLFEFSEQVTAIVGPNGSGKSNIADSLRWVLGEQSYSLLRGKKTEDMIFSGSELRPRAGMAAATVTLDNQDGWLPIDFSEVAITRRAYRDGTNEYLINNQRVRLKDVSELLAQSGLAERTYTIIGQGLVDAALALRAEDRRRLFEEAAGIGLYRARREEALRRLETTQRNLERVQDILAELEPRLSSLERQARRAQEFEQIKNDLQALLRDWYGFHWRRAQQELMQAREVERLQAAELEKARAAQQRLEAEVTELRQRIQVARQQLNDWLRSSAELLGKREVLLREQAVAGERAHYQELQARDGQDELERLGEEISLQEELLSSVNQDVQRLEGDLSDAHSQAQAAQLALEARQLERRQAEDQLQQIRSGLSQLEARHAQFEARQIENAAQRERAGRALESASHALARLEGEVQDNENRLAEAQAEAAAAQADFKQAEATWQAGRQRLASLEDQRSQAQAGLVTAEAEYERARARSDVLEQAEASLSGYTNGARALLQAIRQERLSGRPGVLSAYLDVPPRFEKAIGAALGPFLEGVLLDGELEPAFELLETELGRAVLLPGERLRSFTPLTPDLFGLEGRLDESTGWIGVASQQVQTTTGLRPLVDFLLGGIWLVRDWQSGLSILNDVIASNTDEPAIAGLRVVTLDGELLYSGGPLISSGAGGGASEQTLLTRQRQRKELLQQAESQRETAASWESQRIQAEAALQEETERLKSLEAAYGASRQALAEAELSLQRARLSLEQAEQQRAWQAEQRAALQAGIAQAGEEGEKLRAELDEQDGKIQAQRGLLRENASALAGLVLDEYQTQVAHWETRAAVAERALADEHRRRDERQARLEQTNLARQNLSSRLVELAASREVLKAQASAAQAEELRVTEALAEEQARLAPAEAEITRLEADLAGLENRDALARQALSLVDHRHASARISLARNQEALAALQRRIEDDFGLVAFEFAEQVSGQAPLPLEGMVEQLPHVQQLAPDIEEAIRRQRAQLRRIGPINPEAQAEYTAVKERHRFMTEQVADLQRASADLQQVIAELDSLMERDFNKTFEAVAGEFKTIFQRLFGGGSARLVLTDPDNLTETGIDIEARLPGRRTQGLSLLSGGERSLTATALVFALMKVSPTPFCVLDEVDAMLDEANVGRFRELLRELSERTQFVIVTHNRNTVQAADVIYGVTMGRDSVSQVLSLKMDQVEEVFD